MNEEEKIHINSFKFYDRDELEDLAKQYYLENQQLKEQLETSEKARKEAIEYIKTKPLYEEEYDYDYDDELELLDINSEQAENDLLQILDIDKGE